MYTRKQIQPTIRPTEYRCYIKGDDHHYGAAGAEASSWAKPFVRRSTPHPAALDARFLLCSPHIIVYQEEKVNRNCHILAMAFRTNLYRYVYIKCCNFPFSPVGWLRPIKQIVAIPYGGAPLPPPSGGTHGIVVRLPLAIDHFNSLRGAPPKGEGIF